MYLTAVIDWYTRYVLSWEVSNSLHGDFCIAAVEAAMKKDVLKFSTPIKAVSTQANSSCR